MTPNFDATTDFAQAVDGLESVSLLRRGSSQAVAISSARRQQETTLESEPSDGAARQADIQWHLQLPVGELSPEVGDAVVDLQGNRWTILQVEALSYLGRWKCAARDLRIVYGCLDRVDIERAVWDDLGSGPEIVGWNYAFSALPVKIQPSKVVVDNSVTPVITTAHFDIILSETIALEPDDRFVDEAGTIYQLVSYEQSERIDVLPIAKVTRIDV